MQVATLNPHSESTVEALVVAAQSGDRAAFNELVEKTHRMLRKVALPLLPTSLVEDALQETYVLMYQKLHYLREPNALRPWLSRIALRVCYDLLRKTKPTEPLNTQHEIAEEQDEPLDILALRRALGKLKKNDRNIVILREYLEMSYEEIGDILDLAEGTVKSRLFNARKKLKEIVAGEPELGKQL